MFYTCRNNNVSILDLAQLFLRLVVGKFQANKISEFNIDVSKLSSSQSTKISTFSLISGKLLRASSKMLFGYCKIFLHLQHQSEKTQAAQ